MHTLTVLICTHDRRELLSRALASLDACRLPANWDVRIRVMANACSDDTLDWLAKR
ncbi:glycosyltransferase family 2 protein [Methyloversatilis sp.]